MSEQERSGVIMDMTTRLETRRFGACAQVEAYWESLRNGKALPNRSDIDPRGIEDALNYAFILESIGPGLARIRIAGMHLNDVMGMEVRGMPISSFFNVTSRAPFGRVLGGLLGGPAKMQLSLKSAGAWGQPALQARMLLLPMVSDMGDVSRVLGCFETSGDVGRAPRRFDLEEVSKTLLEDAHPDACPTESNAQPAMHAFAEAPAPFKPNAERPSYLRLVTTNDE